MPNEHSNKAKAIATALGVSFGLAMTGGVLSIAAISTMEDARDEQVTADVKVVALEIDKAVKQAIQDEGDSAKTKDVKDIIGDKFTSPVHDSTSIFVRGTVERGYCIAGTDKGGEQSEQGIAQFRNKEGVLNEGVFCPYDLVDSTRITGPAYDSAAYNGTDAIDIVKNGIGLFGGLGILGLIGGAMSRQPKYDYDYEESPSQPSPVEPSKKPASVSPSLAKSGPEFTKEGLQHKLAQDVSLRSGPGSFYPQIATAKNKTILTTTGHSNSGWYEVLIAGKTGWVNSEFLLGASPSAPIPARQDLPSVPATDIAKKSESRQEVKPVRTINVRALMTKYSTIREEWASYELDLIKVLDYPSITNLSIPATGNFHKALSFAGYLAENITQDSSMHEAERFEEAVLDLNHKFNVMLSEAKRLKWNSYTPQEQTSLRTAQKLLAMATNDSSTVHERQIAYKRLIKEIEGIIVLPEKAMFSLKARVSLELNSSIKS